MFSAVLFDLDETLVARRAGLVNYLKDQYRRFSPGLVDVDLYVQTFLGLEGQGQGSREVTYQALLDTLGISCITVADLIADHATHYTRFTVLNAGARELIASLKASGISVGVITNGKRDSQVGKLQITALLDQIDELIVADEDGLRKPDPAIFSLALERLANTAGSTLFVGDEPEADMIGAAGAGLRTAWIRNGKEWPRSLAPRPDFAVDSLAELAAIILSRTN